MPPFFLFFERNLYLLFVSEFFLKKSTMAEETNRCFDRLGKMHGAIYYITEDDVNLEKVAPVILPNGVET